MPPALLSPCAAHQSPGVALLGCLGHGRVFWLGTPSACWLAASARVHLNSGVRVNHAECASGAEDDSLWRLLFDRGSTYAISATALLASFGSMLLLHAENIVHRDTENKY